MTKSKMSKKSDYLQLTDVGGFILSLYFVYSVINNARDLIDLNIKNAPASYGLILALILVTFGCYQRKKLSIWNIVTITILATSVVIWLLGLSSTPII